MMTLSNAAGPSAHTRPNPGATHSQAAANTAMTQITTPQFLRSGRWYTAGSSFKESA